MPSFFKNTKYWKRPPLNKLDHWQQVPQNLAKKLNNPNRGGTLIQLSALKTAVAISKSYIRTLLFNLLDVVFSAVKSINFGLFLNENVAGVPSVGKWNTGIWFYHDYGQFTTVKRANKIASTTGSPSSEQIQIFNSVPLTVFFKFRYCKMEKKHSSWIKHGWAWFSPISFTVYKYKMRSYQERIIPIYSNEQNKNWTITCLIYNSI